NEERNRRASEAIAEIEQRLAANNQRVVSAERAFAQLQQRASDTSAALEHRIDDFEERARIITETLGEASRVTSVLSALDARIVDLDAQRSILEEAASALESRAANTSAEVAECVGNLDSQKRN